MDELGDRLRSVNTRIDVAARAAGRDRHDIHLIVVTKNHPASLIRELADRGVDAVGENRDQEAAAKATELSDLGVRWHFVGQLQTNKVTSVLNYSDVVHSVDRQRLVDAMVRDGRPVQVFLQVNLSDDPGRGGCRPEDLEPLAETVHASGSLQLKGVMAVAPLGEEPRSAFARLRGYSELVRSIQPTADGISAGMSHDFEDAIAEGATHLRIGAAITGNRPVQR